MTRRSVRLFALLLCMAVFSGRAQTDSCTLRISLLTCSPGADLYSLFGHTAIRVEDSVRRYDVVYNFGTFDDSDPLFYLRFTRGIMMYSLSASTFADFIVEYREEHRGVVAQELALDCAQKLALVRALENNGREQNRFYPYHFYADNCTTRAGKAIAAAGGTGFSFRPILPDPHPTYRDLIHDYLRAGKQSWSQFGIDVLLGMAVDKRVTDEQAIYFLPDYLLKGLDSARLGAGPAVLGKRTLLAYPPEPVEGPAIPPPAAGLALLAMALAVTLARSRKTARVFDTVFFFLLGLLGLVIAFLWLGRVDNVCRNNLNIAWAIPFHGVAVWFLGSRKRWIRSYFFATAAASALLLAGWAFWPQGFHIAVLPIGLAVILRSVAIATSHDHANESALAA